MKKAALALAAVLALVLTASALGDDFSQGKGVHKWNVLSLRSGHWKRKPAQPFADGIGFAFGTTRDPRLFLTNHLGSGLLGDLTGKTLTATFTITGTATAFTSGEGPPENACGTAASARLYFERNFKASFNNSDLWWSSRRAYPLTSLVGHTLTLT